MTAGFSLHKFLESAMLQCLIFAATMYKIVRQILFLFDPEKVHHFSMSTFMALCNIPFIQKQLYKIFAPAPKPISKFGLLFNGWVGLAAGFDKNASYFLALKTLGFSHVEIGTVTPKAQDGNDKPRLFRLPEDQALINRMGFNNDGATVIAKRLQLWKEQEKDSPQKMIIGGNIGKNKNTPNEEAWKDYEICFKALHDYVDYFTVNVSSPNTPGLRALQEKDALQKILVHLQNINAGYEQPKPIFLKIAPDLNTAELDDVIDLAMAIKLDALVVSNTSLNRSKLSTNSQKIADKIGAGGLSGKPIKYFSTEMIRYIQQKTNGSLPIIASGGIFTGADAQEKINAGASLVQIYTGFIYEGPAIIKNINDYLNK